MTDRTDVHGAVRDSACHDAPRARAHSADNATCAAPPATADTSTVDAASAENPVVASDTALAPSTTNEHVAASPAPNDDESARAAANSEAPSSATPTCRACGSSSNIADLRICTGCAIAVHASCYGASLTDAHASDSSEPHEQHEQHEQANETAVAADSQEDDSAAWTCDCCAHDVASVRDLQCVFCEQRGDVSDCSAMKRVDTRAWRQQPAGEFAHLLCSRWDPHAFTYVVPSAAEGPSVEPQPPQQLVTRGARKLDSELRSLDTAASASVNVVATTTTDADTVTAATELPPAAPLPTDPPAFDYALTLPSACCFCASVCGIRIQCQHIGCSLWFHAMCAYTRTGLIAMHPTLPGSPLIEHHAYCMRHCESAMSVLSVLQKLLTKPVAALTGRDTVLRLQAVRRRLDAHAFSSLDGFLDAVAAVLVDVVHRGLKASKAAPPVANVKHLQALQFFVRHVPQLRVVYRASPLKRLPLGDASDELYELLQTTFDPLKYVGKFAGPVVANGVTCAICHGPFHTRQHVFYCAHPTHPHAQHWRCTKRRSNAREREKIAARNAAMSATTGGSTGASTSTSASNTGISSTKKKLKALALVVDGKWRDVKLPTGLVGVSDGIICALCRSDVDARGLLASRKEGKRAEFAAKTSRFVLGGCYVNTSAALVKAGGSSSHAVAMAAAGSSALRRPLVPKTEPSKPVKAAPSDRHRSKRSSSSSASSEPAAAAGSTTANSSAKMNGVASLDAAAPAALAPPKMERINVQRTTKWLAYVAQIIRLAGTVAKLSSDVMAATAATADSMRATRVKAESTDAVASSAACAHDAAPAACSQTVEPPVVATATATTAVNDAAAIAAAVDVPMRTADATPVDDPADTQPAAAAAAIEASAAPVKTLDTSESLAPAASADKSPAVRVAPVTEVTQLTQMIESYFSEAIAVVEPFDAYALQQLTAAQAFLRARNGPAVGVLRMLANEYTRFLYIKHTRAVDKAANDKRKRDELEALELQERTRKRLERDAEAARQSQLLAMRQKKRKLSKMT